jgi:hypothetical protein
MIALKSALTRGRSTATPAEPSRDRTIANGAAPSPNAAMMGSTAARTVYARLSVTQGRHTGASLDVTKPQITIGSALASNVVLTDADVQPRHALVSFVPDALNTGGQSTDAGVTSKLSARSKKPFTTATIEAIDGNVLAGIQLIEMGQAIDVMLPCTLKFGGCAIELTGPKARRSGLLGSAPTRSRNKRWWVWPTAATLAGAAGLSLLGLHKTVTGEWSPSKLTAPRFDGQKTAMVPPLATTTRTPTPAPSAPSSTAAPELPPAAPLSRPVMTPTAPTAAVPAAVAPPSATPKPPEPAAARTAPANEDRQIADLRQRLLAAGLDKVLSVDKRGNLLVVDGIVSSATYGRWREVKDALSLTAGNSVITDLVKTSTSANVPNNSIASVILGKSPYVMSTNGRRARVGEVLEDGWTVEAISAETVTMRRGQTVNRINPADGFSK